MFGLKNTSTCRSIFWSVLQATLQTNIAIPNILHQDFDVEQLFDKIFESLDPFYRTLYGAIEDPSGWFNIK
jgi:hypothetical protein